MTKSTWAFSMLSAVMLVACDGTVGTDAADSGGGGALVVLDSVDLQEDDTVIIAKPVAFAMTPGGDHLLGDMVTPRIYRFDRHGRFARSYGRLGRGPGEMIWTNHAFVAGDTLLIVADNSQQRLNLASGAFLGAKPVNGSVYSGSSEGD